MPATVTGSSGAIAPNLIDLACEAGREGSGLLGFTATLVGSDGVDTSVKLTESDPPKVDLEVGADGNTTFPANITAGNPAYLKITATGQKADNPANYYRCSVYFFTKS